jgi:aminoacrylate peracid reductase
MSGHVVTPEGVPPPLAPYSPGIKAGKHLYTSGMLALDNAGQLVGDGDAAVQTRQVLENIRGIVEAAGGKMSDIVFNSIWLKTMDDYAKMNATYAEYFPNNPPARACVRADLVKPQFLVEIASVAYLD